MQWIGHVDRVILINVYYLLTLRLVQLHPHTSRPNTNTKYVFNIAFKYLCLAFILQKTSADVFELTDYTVLFL